MIPPLIYGLRKSAAVLRSWWLTFAKAVGFVNTRILLSIVYVVFVGPVWLFLKLRGKDYLNRSAPDGETFWEEREPSVHTLERSRQQF